MSKRTDLILQEWLKRRAQGDYYAADLQAMAPPIHLWHIHILMADRATLDAVLNGFPEQEHIESYVTSGQTMFGGHWYLVLANRDATLSFEQLTFLRTCTGVLGVSMYEVTPGHLGLEERAEIS